VSDCKNEYVLNHAQYDTKDWKNGKEMTVGLSDSIYAELLLAFPPRPIRSESALQQAQNAVNSILDQGPMGQEEHEYINVLGTLIHEYEQIHHPVPDIYGVELLKILIEENELRQKDLVPIFKTESIVSAVMHGERNLTVEHIQKLAEYFHVSPSVFFAKL
jgi:HTH-type transcriptional regulator / antitoxin HigA